MGSLENVVFLTGDRKFESISLQQTVCLSSAAAFEGREPGLSARVCADGLATASAETPGCFDIAPTGGNVSVGPNSSTAVRLDVVATVPGRSGRSQGLSGLSIGKSLKFGSGLSKAEHGPLIVPGKRQT